MTHKASICVAACLALILLVLPGRFAGAGEKPFEVERIAHAGGGLGKRTYTNSYEALDANLARGFKYFELDFVFTSDEKLVCLHDWKANFERTFGFAVAGKLTLSEFEKLAAENPQFRNCTLVGLLDWLNENPSARIVTDVRGDNLKALEQIKATAAGALRHFIPQVYEPGDFEKIRAQGYEEIIWTLYRFRGSHMDVLNWVDQWSQPFAVTMPRERAMSMLPVVLSARGVPTYVHTINSDQEVVTFLHELSVSEIYTDFLAPAGPANGRD